MTKPQSRVEPASGPSGSGVPENMRWIPPGTFLMGSESFYPEEQPVHRVEVDGFWVDEHPVTAADFRRFVRETSYVTFCERPLAADLTSDDQAALNHAEPERADRP